jgi:hypothetical protein
MKKTYDENLRAIEAAKRNHDKAAEDRARRDLVKWCARVAAPGRRWRANEGSPK